MKLWFHPKWEIFGFSVGKNEYGHHPDEVFEFEYDYVSDFIYLSLSRDSHQRKNWIYIGEFD